MTLATLLFALVKIVIIIAFLMNMGGVLTWVERRQMSMIQDRVGPNRAVIYLPTALVQALALGLGCALFAAAGVAGYFQMWVPAAVLGVVSVASFGGGVALGGEGSIGLRVAGLLHPLADGVKFIAKEDFIPANADKLLHSLAPMISVFPVFVTFAVIPFGDTLCLKLAPGDPWSLYPLLHATLPNVMPAAGTCAADGVPLQLVNLDVGILYMFALAGTGIIGAAIAGWSSDNKYALLGGLRAASQMVSYEVAMGLSLVGAFMTFGSLRLEDMVRWQADHAWGIFVQPLAFFLFLATSIAENKRVPFDAPEGESEIVAGYFLEYSGMKFSMFMLGEYIEIVVSSAVLTTVFLGGWSLPFVTREGLHVAIGDTVLVHQPLVHAAVVIVGMLAFFGKVILLSWANIFIRWTVPRFRYDQIMALGWKKLLPLSIGNIVVTGVVLLAIDAAGEGVASALKIAGDLTHAAVALGGAALAGWFVLWAIKPIKHEQLVASSSAQFASRQGGTKTAPMQA